MTIDQWGGRWVQRVALFFMGLAVTLAGCAPGGPGQSREPAASGQPAAPKTVRLGITADAEPTEGGIMGARSAGGFEVIYALHAALTIYDTSSTLEIVPRLAERVPTIENGDWQVFPDGTMEVAWQLRPNARWHDGTPVTAEDFVLGFQIAVDDPFGRGTGTVRQMADVVATDPQSLTIRWKNLNIFANAMGIETGLIPYPRHKLGALWEAGDKQAFANSPYLADEFVGLGPYKIREWLRGSYLEAEAFDGYFEGKPKIDRLSLRFVGDTNTLVVMFMAGELDVIPVGSLKAGEADVLKRQYETAGMGRIVVSDAKLRQGMPQLRDPDAIWARDPRIRQALTQLIDRPALAETVQFGLAAVDDITLQRTDPAYSLAKQKGLPKLEFDSSQAHRLLAEAGLTRGADGTYQPAAGAPFSFELSTTGDIQTNVQEMLAIANAWKQAGMQVENVIIPGTANKDEVRNKLRGINLTSSDLAYRGFESFITREIATEARRWRGDNITGWGNPAFDDSYQRLLGTINSAERSQIAADLVKTLLDQVLYIPLTYSGDVSAVSRAVGGVTGVMRPQPVTAWNVHAWEMN